jgi:hypothetical protein
MPEMKARWDIFCTVVDNFGDIGVTWRLARQLVAEHSVAVRLWVDDLRAFERIVPGNRHVMSRSNGSKVSRCVSGRPTGSLLRPPMW